MRLCKILTLLVLLALFSGHVHSALADEVDAVRLFEKALVSAIEKAEKSVVSIARVEPEAALAEPRPVDPFGPRFDRDPASPGYVPLEFGTGVILAKDKQTNTRFILTNRHVVTGTKRAKGPAPEARLVIRLANHRVVDAQLVAADPRSDLAVLRFELQDGLTAEDAPPLAIGEAETLKKGQFVVALGNPYAIARDGSASASLGIISNISRRPALREDARPDPEEQLTIHEYGTLLHVDTRLNLGSSGGALIDLDGKLVGLTTALAALEGYEQSAGFAIPIDTGLRRIVDSLLEGYEVEYGFLGVAPRDATFVDLQDDTGQAPQASAAAVERVAMDSPAHQANLRPGDFVLRINGTPVLGSADLMREVGLLGPDAVARFTIWRPQQRSETEVSIRLGKWPVYDDTQIVTSAQRRAAWRGLQVDFPTARRRFMPGEWFPNYVRAVVVSAVTPGSPAEAEGLRPGDFIRTVAGTGVETPTEFVDATNNASGVVTLELVDGRKASIREAPPTSKPQ